METSEKILVALEKAGWHLDRTQMFKEAKKGPLRAYVSHTHITYANDERDGVNIWPYKRIAEKGGFMISKDTSDACLCEEERELRTIVMKILCK